MLPVAALAICIHCQPVGDHIFAVYQGEDRQSQLPASTPFKLRPFSSGTDPCCDATSVLWQALATMLKVTVLGFRSSLFSQTRARCQQTAAAKAPKSSLLLMVSGLSLHGPPWSDYPA